MKLRARLLSGAVLTALLAIGVVIISVDRTISTILQLGAPWVVPQENIDVCERNPAEWSAGVFNIARIYAYYPDGTSENPFAPPLNPTYLRMLEIRREPWVRDRHGGLVRVSEAGPCAMFQLQTSPPPVQQAVRWSLMIGAALSMLVVTLFTQLFAINPLLVRLARVQRGARAIGSGDYVNQEDGTGDALSEIATVLDRSNDRILADRQELVLRQQALERHLAEIAHDLRTPLASLLLALQEVSAEVGDSEATRRALGDAAYVTSLVDNLHEATRLRRGASVTAGQADLHIIVERLGARFVALGRHQERAVAVAIPEGPVIVGCTPSFAERAIANLVHNAISHGQEGGNVAVILERTDEAFSLVVMDDGPGVSEDKLADLSAATFRADAARQRSTGLGLAITNEIVRRAGWSIDYALLEPSGLKITIEGALFTLP
ncbi:MAG: HAMP domain-containing sensor histidine kinase [Myxococcota bacterium]